MRGGDGELLVMVLGETRRAGAVQHWPRARQASRDSALSHTRIRRPHRHTSGDAQLAGREDGSAHIIGCRDRTERGDIRVCAARPCTHIAIFQLRSESLDSNPSCRKVDIGEKLRHAVTATKVAGFH